MKRIMPLLFAILLLTAHVPVASASSASEAAASSTPASGPETDPGSRATEPFLRYRFYDQSDWDTLTSAVMFNADLDQDCVEEPVSFSLDQEAWTTAITWGESTVVLEEGSDFIEAAVLDLDTGSPFYNLLVVVDYGSDSYMTVEIHPENGQLVKGTVVDGDWSWADDALWFSERTDFLGTGFGMRTYSGDTLTPDSEWLTMWDIPSEQEIEEEWEFLVDMGILLHTVYPVPCTVNGQPYTIPEDSYLYRLRFKDTDDLMEVALLDGTVALIACIEDEDGWPSLLGDHDKDDCFDNLFYAD